MAGKDKRTQILEAAEREFRAGRFHEITMDSVAAAAGVGKGTLYLYFKSKDDLFFQMTTAGFDELCGLLRGRIDGQASFEVQLMQSTAAISSFFRSRRELFSLIQPEDARAAVSRDCAKSAWQKKRHLLVDALADVMRRGRKAGLVGRNLPPRTAAIMFLGLLRARARDFGSEDPKLEDATLIRIFLHGVSSAMPVSAGKRSAINPSTPENVL